MLAIIENMNYSNFNLRRRIHGFKNLTCMELEISLTKPVYSQVYFGKMFRNSLYAKAPSKKRFKIQKTAKAFFTLSRDGS